MKNRKYLVGLCLAVAFILTPVLSHAQTPTIAELQAQIAALQRQLAILQSQQNNTDAWCHTFNTNLSIGMNGDEVVALHRALGQAGFAVTSGEKVFSEETAAAVSGFQIRYRSEILAPLGLANPTGYFGPATRAVMNRLYGCDKFTVDRTPTVVNQSLIVISPNGGESWSMGSRQSIRWSWSTVSTNLNIYLRAVSNNGSWTLVNGVDSRNGISGWEIIVPPVPIGDYKVLICKDYLQNLDTVVCDYSDSSFRIVDSELSRAPADPFLTVTSPDNNTSWTSANGPVIQWTSNIPPGNTVTVELLTPSNGSVSGWSNFTTANDGSESGRLTNSTVPSGSYYFRLKTVVNGQVFYGGSGVFQFTNANQTPPPAATTYTLNLITAGTGSGLTSRSPNQTNYPAGTAVTITASPTNGSTFTGWSGSRVSATNPVTVTMNGNLNIYANFTAAVSLPIAAPSLTVSSPANNSSWSPTNGPVVSWTTANVPDSNNVLIELLTPANGSVSGFTSRTVRNDQRPAFNLLTGSTVASGSYYFRLSTTVNGQTTYGGSGVFQFTQPATASVTVTSPTGGSFSVGAPLTVNWTTSGITPIPTNISEAPITVMLFEENNMNNGYFLAWSTYDNQEPIVVPTVSPLGNYKIRVAVPGFGQSTYFGWSNPIQVR